MYFKSLQLTGFKSFATKTKLNFVDGVTAVVGPNGSGKSNISDAIRWVMGEMSAKSLRGSKMEDVIFSGTDKRSPMAFAEVTIVMDNSDRSLNIDFDEISVTRRVYRSGESEYQINNATCRLKDIHELFMDTGLGRDGYSIIGQGKIDEILSAKSEDRRYIFDEAAGITKYRYKKEEAERKLSQTNDNLLRITDILTEIENNLTPLEHQAKKAKKYLQLREVQKNLEINLWLKTLDSFDSQLSSIENIYNTTLSQKNTYEEAINSEENALISQKEEYRMLEGLIDENKAAVYARKNEITRILGEIELTKTNIENHKKDILRLEGEIGLHKEKIISLKDEISQKKVESLKLGDKHKELEIISNNTEQEYENTSIAISDANEKLKKLRDDLALKQAEISSNAAKIESSAGYFESLRIRLSEILAEKSSSALKIVELEKEIKATASSLENITESTRKNSENAEKLSKEILDLKEEYDNKLSKLDEISIEEKSLEHKKSTLESMENSFEGYPHSVKSIMNEVRNGSLKKAEIYGPVSQLISTDAKYVLAIESALGGALNHIVTNTENDAKKAIEYLKATKSGRATFLPVTSVKFDENFQLPEGNGVIGIASDLVKTKTIFSQIIRFILGKTIVTDNIENAISLAQKNKYKIKIVTLDGEVVFPGGSLSGGYNKGSAGALSRNAEIDEISNKIKSNCKVKDVLQDECNKLKEILLQKQSEFDALNEQMWQGKSAQITEKSKLENLQYSLKTETARNENLSQESEKVDEVINATNTANADILSVSETIKIESLALENEISLLEAKINELTENLNKLSENLSNIRTDKAVSLKEMEVQAKWLQDSENTVVSTEMEISGKTIHINSLTDDISKYEQNITIYEDKISELKLADTIGEDEILKQANLRLKKEKEIENKENEIKTLKDNIYKLREELARIESKKQRLEETREDIITKMWEEYELTYSSADSLRSDIGNEQEAQKQLASTKAGIRSLGNVNVDSIEEYKTQKERFDFLSTQKNDLEEAKGGLENLISEMTVIMTEMFEENFSKLNAKFGETFSDLFGGGKACVRLSDPADILGSGIEIDVQPPGKKLQSITLLSGGEKAFTAIALIFAILKIKPTYFCIFDEIEAALDDVNVFRYADYLKKFSENTQFILITHRKGTMEIADTLYGVTMQEKGITTLLSLDLDTYKE